VPYARVFRSKSVPGQISSGYPYGRHLNQQTKILIKRDARRSRLPVDLEPDFDRFRPIIFFTAFF
jgi:hypothetical protein